MKRNFMELLQKMQNQRRFACLGLDPVIEKIPDIITRNRSMDLAGIADSFVAYAKPIIDATKDIVGAYKPNSGFYEKYGPEGIRAQRQTIEYIQQVAPDVPVINDAKRGDIDNTNNGYVDASFGFLKADAITVNPYLGGEALAPFLECKDKGIIVLCRTSNSGASEFQDTFKQLATLSPGPEREEFIRFEKRLGDQLHSGGVPLYQYVAFRVAEYWNKNGNCLLVVGATFPGELAFVRAIVGDMPLLIPGIGAQGGDLEKTVHAGKNSKGQGMIINSSRAILYASSGHDFADAARRETEKLHNQIISFL